MATRPVTREADEVVCETFVAAPPERVFQALTIPEQILEWWRDARGPLERLGNSFNKISKEAP